jgi:hypothetical protein
MKLKLSPQAIGALLMTLQKCLSEQVDITDLLSGWDLENRDGLVYVLNAPTVSAAEEQEDAETSNFKFDLE